MNTNLINFWWEHVSIADKQFILHQYFCEGQADCVINSKHDLSQEIKRVLFEQYSKSWNTHMTEEQLVKFLNDHQASITEFIRHLKYVEEIDMTIFEIRTYRYCWVSDYVDCVYLSKWTEEQNHNDERKSLNCID